MQKYIYSFNSWRRNFKAKFKIKKITKIFDLYRNNKIFYQGVDINFKDRNNEIFRRFLFIHKKGVQIIPIIFCKTDKQYYTILVRQIRVGAANETLEFPSGSVEKDETYSDAAKKEVLEELGISLKKKNLKKIFKPLIIQPTFCNLTCQFFYFKLKLTKKKLLTFNNIQTGVRSDNETCTTVVKKIKDLNNLYYDSILIGLKLIEKKLKIKL